MCWDPDQYLSSIVYTFLVSDYFAMLLANLDQPVLSYMQLTVLDLISLSVLDSTPLEFLMQIETLLPVVEQQSVLLFQLAGRVELLVGVPDFEKSVAHVVVELL